MISDDTEYYRGRAIMERRMARLAKDDRAAAIHADLARECEKLAEQAELGPLPQKPDRIVADLQPGSFWHSDWKGA